jgi:hypothetical protein
MVYASAVTSNDLWRSHVQAGRYESIHRLRAVSLAIEDTAHGLLIVTFQYPQLLTSSSSTADFRHLRSQCQAGALPLRRGVQLSRSGSKGRVQEPAPTFEYAGRECSEAITSRS